MISIDEWPYLPGSLKPELLTIVSSSDPVTHTHKILHKPCSTNPNLVFSLKKGLSRKKSQKLKIYYKVESPKQSSTKCFKAVFSLPQIDADMHLGKEIIDYNWETVKTLRNSTARLFLTLTTDSYIIVYELPEPIITADSSPDTKSCSLIHIRKHAISIDDTYSCTSSFGPVSTQIALPSLNLDYSFYSDFFTYNENFKQLNSEETFGKASPFGKIHRDIFSTYYNEIIKTVKGQTWLFDDKSNECGNIFMISKFQSEASNQAFIQFNNLILTEDKQRASEVFNKLSSDFEDLFVLNFWDFINLRQRLKYSALLAEHDFSILKSSINKIDDAWVSIINTGNSSNDIDLFGVLIDLLVVGFVDDMKITQLEKCFSGKNLKKLASCVTSLYENSKKVTSLIMSLEALRLNTHYCVSFLESERRFCSLIEADFLPYCQKLVNKLDSFFEDKQHGSEFNENLLSTTLNLEALHHESFFLWINDLSKNRFAINKININDLSTDKMIYDYLKVEQRKYINQINKQEDNSKIVRLLLQTVEDMDLKKLSLNDESEHLPSKLQTFINDYT